ncbi:MAG: hypothetical protein ACOCZV_00665 [Nanoarchaeota archaeon]
MRTTKVIAYGGSIVIPKTTYDQDAIDRLVCIAKHHPDTQFIIIIGGGMLCRNVNERVKDILSQALDSEKDINTAFDELGIAVTKINARTVIERLTAKLGVKRIYQQYIDNPELLPETDAQIIIASGFKPGVTTDYCMMRLAELSNASSAIKVSNFPVVLDVKPTEFNKDEISSYRKLTDMTWSRMRSLVGDTAVAGGNYPLDPPSAMIGQQLNQENDFSLLIGEAKELENMVAGLEFYGTTVHGE